MSPRSLRKSAKAVTTAGQRDLSGKTKAGGLSRPPFFTMAAQRSQKVQAEQTFAFRLKNENDCLAKCLFRRQNSAANSKTARMKRSVAHVPVPLRHRSHRQYAADQAEKGSELTGCTILGKAEFLNPGHRSRDRAALYIIRDAEKKGPPEARWRHCRSTAGNTGIVSPWSPRRSAIAPLLSSRKRRARKRRTRCAFSALNSWKFRPSLTGPEQLCESLGPSGGRTGEDEPRARSGPTSSTMSPIAKRTSRRPRRKSGESTGGKVDGFICAVGSGGTLAGTAMGLHRFNKDIKIGLADPEVLHFTSITRPRICLPRLVHHRRHRPGPHHGQSRRLHPGLLLSRSGQRGAADRLRSGGKRRPLPWRLVGHQHCRAIRLAKDPCPGHTVVTILCDYGNRYQSKLFNPSFLEGKGLPVPQWLLTNPDIRVPYLPVD